MADSSVPRSFRHLLETSLRKLRAAADPVSPGPPLAKNTYEVLYETVAQEFSDEDAVGGLFDLVGRIELSLFLMEGLKPTHTLLDFGCGTGRLAIKAIPTKVEGRYIGLDISQSMLDRARARVEQAVPQPSCGVEWVRQTIPHFPFPDSSVNFICAFSVFTHMEHEDAHRYLKDARRLVRPAGRFVFSCLPMNMRYAQEVFLASAEEELHARWSKVRNVTTSLDLMTPIAELAGWRVLRWYPGDEQNIRLVDTGELAALGRSSCVLEPST